MDSNFKIDKDGNKRWYKNGRLHRVNGPAIEYTNGTKHWYQHGKRHRLDGAAIEFSHGTKRWYVRGVKIEKPKLMKVPKLNWLKYGF